MKLHPPGRGRSRPTLLECGLSGATGPGPSAATRTAVLFTGAGAPSPALTRALYGTFPAYRSAFDALCRSRDARLPMPLVAGVFAPADGADVRLLREPPYARGALFGYQVALFRLWESWGLGADAVAAGAGGRVAAAHGAGSLPAAAAARRRGAGPEEEHRGAFAGRAPGAEGYGTVLACGPVPTTGTAVGDVPALVRALAALQLHGPSLDWERLASGATKPGPAPAP
ncbi:hypothetical protein AB8B12_29055 [Streptomyces sp. PGLac3x]